MKKIFKGNATGCTFTKKLKQKVIHTIHVFLGVDSFVLNGLFLLASLMSKTIGHMEKQALKRTWKKGEPNYNPELEGKEAEKDCWEIKADCQEGLCLIFICICRELCEWHKMTRYSSTIWNLCLISWCDKSHKHWFQSFLWCHYQQIPPTAFFIQSPIVHLSEREFLCVLSNFHVVRLLVFSYLQFDDLVTKLT